ncbi:aspartate/glutamate racemase family protein [Saccharopolyspora sp. NPDC002686]|uniref:maleate cis-trans isomerase family protein n=1 Tax=Saccharopolyspora sp. NPDC002686 TaxID=3154541 RepID=UPI00332B9E46
MTAQRPFRLGMIVPSSNTCLEPQTYRILGDRTDVTVHSARTEVTRIGLDQDSDRQFDVSAMRGAGELLATAKVDAIAWNGTSGSWLGIEHDREITAAITDATGIRATTSSLALLELLRRHDLGRIALLTPYTDDVNDSVAAVYDAHGIEVTSSVGWSLSDNEAFAGVAPDELLEPSRKLLREKPDALVYLCTNLYGAPVVAPLEAEFGIPVLDSVAVTLWHSLVLAGAPLLDPRWGSLLS